MRTFFLLALWLLLLPAASAQSSDKLSDGPEVEMLGNFEIQDLMVRIDYGEARRGRSQATVTVRSPKGFADASSVYLALVAATPNGRTDRIPLRIADDGSLTGTGTLPTLGELDELALMADRDTGLRFGIPVYDGRQGKTFTSSRQGNGWRIDITIETDPPVIVIVVEGD